VNNDVPNSWVRWMIVEITKGAPYVMNMQHWVNDVPNSWVRWMNVPNSWVRWMIVEITKGAPYVMNMQHWVVVGTIM
jgi:hypothetical protein